MLPFAAGGVGLSLLENKLLGENLPEPVKRVNLGLGATQGALLADPGTRAQALASLPMKQMALVGLGSLDRFRRSQQGLVDTNLRTAKLNERTARIMGRDAGGRKALMAAFLLPALVGGGAAGYMAFDKYRKSHRASSRYDTIASSGKPPSHQKIRIDIPPGALPKGFYDSLSGIGNSDRAFTRLEEQGGGVGKRLAKLEERRDPDRKLRKAAALYKAAYGAPQHHGLLPILGNMAWEFTGIPSFDRAVRDTGGAYSSLESGDHQNALRYGAGALGNAAMGAVALRTGMYPVLGKLLGKARLGGVIARNPAGRLGSGFAFPGTARHIFRNAFGNELSPLLDEAGNVRVTGAQRMANRHAFNTALRSGGPNPVTGKAFEEGAKPLDMAGPLDRARNIKFRYDPNKFAWDNPSAPNPVFPGSVRGSPIRAAQNRMGAMFNRFLTNPAGRTTPPPQGLPGQLFNLARYGANRAVNAGYWGTQFARRNPNLSLTALGMPLAGKGVLQDKANMDADREALQGYVPDYARNQGPYGMPISSALSGLLGGVGQDVNKPLRDQVQGVQHDPWHLGRMAAMAL